MMQSIWLVGWLVNDHTNKERPKRYERVHKFGTLSATSQWTSILINILSFKHYLLPRIFPTSAQLT